MFDGTGDRLTPSHANKKGRRYRYYVSNRLIAQSGQRVAGVGAQESDRHSNADHQTQHEQIISQGPCTERVYVGGWRLPAPAFEQAVADAVLNWLQQATLPTAKFAALVSRIDLNACLLSIRIDAAAIAEICTTNVSRIGVDALTFSERFEQRKRGVEAKFLLGHRQPQPDPVLIHNVAIAHFLYMQLKQGILFAELAEAHQTSIPQMHRLMSFVFLSPKVVEAICAGQQPADMSTQRLREMVILSAFKEQHALFEL